MSKIRASEQVLNERSNTKLSLYYKLTVFLMPCFAVYKAFFRCVALCILTFTGKNANANIIVGLEKNLAYEVDSNFPFTRLFVIVML